MRACVSCRGEAVAAGLADGIGEDLRAGTQHVTPMPGLGRPAAEDLGVEVDPEQKLLHPVLTADKAMVDRGISHRAKCHVVPARITGGVEVDKPVEDPALDVWGIGPDPYEGAAT